MKYSALYLLVGMTLVSAGGNMDAYMSTLEKEARLADPGFNGFEYSRGEKIYFSKHRGKRGKIVSCSSCHTENLSASGKHLFTGKVIKPLSPFANPQRFSKVKKVKKWLRRNFKDVYKREGTAQEKGDVLTFMMRRK